MIYYYSETNKKNNNKKEATTVILYGSYARGDQNQNGEISDIDIMILVDLNEEKSSK